jgi:hypothetical protein
MLSSIDRAKHVSKAESGIKLLLQLLVVVYGLVYIPTHDL